MTSEQTRNTKKCDITHVSVITDAYVSRRYMWVGVKTCLTQTAYDRHKTNHDQVKFVAMFQKQAITATTY